MSPSRPGSGHAEGREKICWKCGRSFHTDIELCPDDGSRLLELTSEDRKDPLIGTLFDGRYRIFHKLGEGGMGAVYSARSLDSNEDVALKLLKSNFARDEGIRKRFLYEAHTISNLNHPHSVRFYDFGQTTDGHFYMAMELLHGESLAERLAYRFVSYGEVFAIIPPICGVLGEAHVREVIHRDLKPENIFLQQLSEGREFPKLIDFGIAKHHGIATMTQSGTLWGTPAYMSPEQARGDVIGARADIYGIGVMLYELISGNLPFHATTQMGFAVKHINEQPRSMLTIPGLQSVPVELDAFVLKLLSKDPEHRPATMEEVATTLLSIRDAVFDDVLLAKTPALEVDPVGLKAWIKSADSSQQFAVVDSGELDSDAAIKTRSETLVPTLSIFPMPAEQGAGDQATVKVEPARPSQQIVEEAAVEAGGTKGNRRFSPAVWGGLVSLIGVGFIVVAWSMWFSGARVSNEHEQAGEDWEIMGVMQSDPALVVKRASEHADQVVSGARGVVRAIMLENPDGMRDTPGSELTIVDEPLVQSEDLSESEQKKSVKPAVKKKRRTLKEALETTF